MLTKKSLIAWLPAVAFVAVAVGIQVVTTTIEKEYYLSQLTMSLYYSVVALGLALVMGYAGQVSLGHAAFFAIGAYSTAVLTTRNLAAHDASWWAGLLKRMHVMVSGQDLYGSATLTVSPWAAFLVALFLAAVIACLIGYPALRLKGHYLAMATLGFGMIVHQILLGSNLTGAADGIVGIPAWELPGGLTVSGKSALRVQNFYIACAFTLIVVLMLRNMVRSRVGRALLAIHDRELAANAMGIDTARYKLKAFVVSAVLAAAAGVLLTHYTGGVGPSEAGPMKSVRYLALVAAGGVTNLWGILGVSAGINFMSLRGMFGSYDHAVFGAILVLIMALTPEGPFAPLAAWIRRWREKKAKQRGAIVHDPA